MLLAGSFSDQKTAMTCCAMQKPTLVLIFWIVLGTNRIIRAKFPRSQCRADVVVDTASDFNQAAKRPFGIRSSRVQKDAESCIGEGVDPLPNGASRVTRIPRTRQ